MPKYECQIYFKHNCKLPVTIESNEKISLDVEDYAFLYAGQIIREMDRDELNKYIYVSCTEVSLNE